MKKIYILLILISSFCSGQNLNFTIDTAVDNGTSITETIVVGPDTFILTVFHSGNEELDDLGGGDLVFFHSAIDPLTPYMLTITKNGLPTNFNLNSIEYDTLEAGTISLTNQDDDFISSPTTYPLGAGTLTITNPANGLNISQVYINPTDNDDLNDFGFHNINVDIAVNCNADFSYDASAYCADEDDPTAIVTGNSGGTFTSGAGLSINASTGSIDVSTSTPGTYTITYTAPEACSEEVSVTINALDDVSFGYGTASYCADDTDPTAIITGLVGGTFSSTVGLSINASTGAIDVSASTPGTYTVTYTTAGACPNASSVSVTVNALDDASFGYDAASYCADDTDPTPIITGLVGGTFSSTVGLSINASTGAIDVSASTPGTYTVIYTTAGACSNASSVSVTVDASCEICTTYTSQDTPAEIDPGATQTEDCENAPNFYSVALPFLGEVGTDVRIDQVMVDISHTFSGDISLILEDDLGNFIFLAENLGGATNDAYNGTIFEDGGTDITVATAPFGEGSYAASGGNFNDIFNGVFIGDDTTWSLLICDNSGDDTGTVNDFSITFCEIENTLSVLDNELLKHIKLYPNPANTIVQFSVPADSYEVYNLIGQKVLSGSEQSIDVQTLNEGMYLVKLTKDDTVGTERLVVKHF